MSYSHFILAIALCSSSALSALEEVTLQLKWTHQFQFAGYYMAQHKGFYRQQGLDVNIVPADQDNPDEQFKVLSGQAQFGVTHSGILQQRLQGKSLVALAAIFQSSPYCWMVRADSDIYVPKDFAGKKISHLGRIEGAELVVMLERAGIDVTQLPLYAGLEPIEDFVAGHFDALQVYISNEPFKLAQQGVATRQICPKHFGLNVYADILFTSEDVLNYRPQTVARFRRASLQGWRYAMSNPDEALAVTQAEYATTKSIEALANEADKLMPFIKAPGIALGAMSQARWLWIAQLYRLDLSEFHKQKHQFIYTEPDQEEDSWSWMLILAAIVGVICVPMYIHLIFFRHRRFTLK
ncbi:ABC transporter substrate-binding protein [Pseudoalteromonas sp. OOF1S-7]|uniref:ABC transporter substrate-binding protein n=1 Tax=Pseudoalteromonas sp. OOF1S-7 TaxID=2917757 RepID=UPI001EF64970|nr:ABC transporter substrate-binding protein [Pseudoalteromonas sp. OOF1S-7]MCG7536950.1 ABC transporter substrate-binding protein [Pseudoalteromonas sp. OOF1S-7]